jgi:hypothetical protein
MKTPSDWPFEDPPNVAVFTTSAVLAGKPILLVTHDEEDGAWQFLCGTTTKTKHARLVGLDCMLRHDPSLRELADLPLGWRAERKKASSKWVRLRNP